ncbi:MAG: FG-GAP repeat domain-containing protein, partial [Candidatus Hodarchaeales archaeon]
MKRALCLAIIVVFSFLILFSPLNFNKLKLAEIRSSNNDSEKFPVAKVNGINDWEWGQLDKPDGVISDLAVVPDISNDSIPEIVVASEDGNIYLLDGNKSTTLWVTKIVDSKLQDRYDGRLTAVSGDIDLDGTFEIVVSGTNIFITLDSSTGAIEWSKPLAGNYYHSIALYDSNGDGNATDIAVRSSSDLITYDYLGNEKWNKSVNYISGDNSFADLGIGDFDGDNDDDITDGFSVFDGDTGTLMWEVTSENTLTDLVVGDFDGDGVDDLAARYFNGNYRISVMNGSGVELWSASLDHETVQLGVGDFNLDGVDDLAMAVWNGSLYVFKNDGFLLWGPVGVSQSYELEVVELNGDSIDDIVLLCTYGKVEAYDGGLGSSLWDIDVGNQHSEVRKITVADIDNDSIAEIFVGTVEGNDYGHIRYWGDVYAIDNNGNSIWNTSMLQSDMTSIRQVLPSNITGDAIPDFFVSTAYDLFALNGSSGSTIWHADPPEYDIIYEISTADVNGDGIQDLIGTTYAILFVLYGNNGSLMWKSNWMSDAQFMNGLVTVDMDSDGLDDILVASREGGILRAFKGTNGTVLWEETDVCEGFQFNKLSLANISLDATLDFIIVSSEKLKVIDGSSR